MKTGLSALRRMNVAVLAVIAVLLVLVAPGASGANARGAVQTCTHGVSSIGPVTLSNGKVVGGSLTPHTQACLP